MLAYESGNYGIGLSNYLHYYRSSVSQNNMALIDAIRREEKDQIFDRHIANFKSRVAARKKTFAENGITFKTIEDLFERERFSELGRIPDKSIKLADGTISDGLPASAQAILKAKTDEISTISEAVQLIQNFLNTYFNNEAETQELIKLYGEEILDYFISSKTRMKGFGKASDAIVNSILSNYNHKFFQKMGAKYGDLNTEIAKMISLVENLPKAEESFSDADKKDIIGTILAKCRGWILQLSKVTGEIAVQQGLIKVTKEFADSINVLASQIQHTGNQKSKVRVKVDDRIDRDLNLLGKTNTFTSTANGDVSIVVDDSKVSGSIGFTVKNDSNIKIGHNGLGITTTGDIKIKQSSPLLYMMIHDLGMSGAAIHQFKQLAVVQDEDSPGAYRASRPMDNPDVMWSELMLKVKYKLFLNALVGVAGTMNQSMYFVANGYIYSIGDILESVASGNPEQTLRMIENTRNGSTGGLNRSIYAEMARGMWEGSKPGQRLSKYYAAQRAEKVEPYATKMLYDTKVNISMRLNDLTLQALNRGNL